MEINLVAHMHLDICVDLNEKKVMEIKTNFDKP